MSTPKPTDVEPPDVSSPEAEPSASPPADSGLSSDAGGTSSDVWSDSRHKRRPDRIGSYVLLYRLGHGGMSEVHLAEHRDTGERVAIKHVPAGGDPSHRQRLRREARTTARFEHPRVVRVREVIDGEQGFWLVMDYVEGTTLYDVTQSGAMEATRALRIALQIAEGLIAAHDLGILHRDLKSENVMLEADDKVRLLDFGLAKTLWGEEESQSLTVHGEVMGTCRAMSPEQARGQELDDRSDLFSLGSLLYEMVTGTSPFQSSSPVATMTRVCNHSPPLAHLVDSQVPRPVSALIAQLISKKRQDRPDDARQTAALLVKTIADLEGVPSFPWVAVVMATVGVFFLTWGALSFRSTGGEASEAPADRPPEIVSLAEIDKTLETARRSFGLDDCEAARPLAYEGLTALGPPRIPGFDAADRQKRLSLAIESTRMLAICDQQRVTPEAARLWLHLARDLLDSDDARELSDAPDIRSALEDDLASVERQLKTAEEAPGGP